MFHCEIYERKNLAEINVVVANNQLKMSLQGKQRQATELRDGTLLIEAQNETQRESIRKLTAFVSSSV